MNKKLVGKKDFSAGGVVWDAAKKKLLLVRVENLLNMLVWTFPKGHPEGDETPAMAALREVREETGWVCTVINPVLDVRYRFTQKGIRYSKTVRWFLMAPVKKAGAFDPKEIKAIKWMGVQEAESILSYESDHKLLKRVLKSF